MTGLGELLREIDPNQRGHVFQQVLAEHNAKKNNNNISSHGNDAYACRMPRMPKPVASYAANYKSVNGNSRRRNHLPVRYKKYDNNPGNFRKNDGIKVKIAINERKYTARGIVLEARNDCLTIKNVYVPKTKNHIPDTVTMCAANPPQAYR